MSSANTDEQQGPEKSATAVTEESEAMLFGYELAKKLIDAGLLPSQAKRFIIDVRPFEPVKIYYECFADKQTLDIVFEGLLRGPRPVVRNEIKRRVAVLCGTRREAHDFAQSQKQMLRNDGTVETENTIYLCAWSSFGIVGLSVSEVFCIGTWNLKFSGNDVAELETGFVKPNHEAEAALGPGF